ncbi:MAG TPA: Abi-alpha family protein [Nocardioidaceae bacterium]|nr:Abi-alpha family protein [Nocardioidaceae bacterium]
MGIFDVAAGVARRLPLGEVPARALELAGSTASRAETELFRLLRSRMEASIAPVAQSGRQLTSVASSTPRDLMASLLERSVLQDAAASRGDWFASVLQQLVPDEARIIAALAEGVETPPLLHVLPRSGHGRILENASLIGRTAALTLPQMTPVYVTHLRALGLVETGPEDESNPKGYELLLAEKVVRVALKEGEMGKLPARVLRRTLQLSERGRELWEHTRPGA